MASGDLLEGLDGIKALLRFWEHNKIHDGLRSLIQRHADRMEYWAGYLPQLARQQAVDARNESRARRSAMRDNRNSVIKTEKSYILLLPDEMLEVIFDKLKDPDDLRSCLASCTRFRKILEPTRTDWLFPEVLPRVMKYLDQMELLDCRLVCKKWKHTVNTIVESVFNRPTTYSDNLPAYWRNRQHQGGQRPQSGYIIDLKDMTGELYQFMEDMDNNLLVDPFLARHLAICDSVSAEEDYWDNISRVLKKFGGLIWKCNIGMVGNIEEEEELEEEAAKAMEILLALRFRDCVSELPNIVGLGVKVHGKPYYIFDEQEVRDISQRYPADSFPPFESLAGLKIDNAPVLFFYMMPPHFWNKLMSLTLDEHELDHILSATSAYVEFAFSKLEFLTLKKVGKKWEDLEKLYLLQCPLISLTVTCYNPKIDMESFLRVFNHFGQTLLRVDISWTGEGLPKPGYLSSYYLEACNELSAPKLTTVKLRNPTDSLNFLLCLEEMNALSIVYDDEEGPDPFVSRRKLEIVQIHGFVDGMHASNVWYKLPFMKTFNISTSQGSYCYTRESFREFRSWWAENFQEPRLTD